MIANKPAMESVKKGLSRNFPTKYLLKTNYYRCAYRIKHQWNMYETGSPKPSMNSWLTWKRQAPGC